MLVTRSDHSIVNINFLSKIYEFYIFFTFLFLVLWKRKNKNDIINHIITQKEGQVEIKSLGRKKKGIGFHPQSFPFF